MENKESRPRWFILLEGVVGYVVLIALGLLTNILSEEFAVTLIEFLIPMLVFVACAIVVRTMAKYVARWMRERGMKEVKE